MHSTTFLDGMSQDDAVSFLISAFPGASLSEVVTGAQGAASILTSWGKHREADALCRVAENLARRLAS